MENRMIWSIILILSAAHLSFAQQTDLFSSSSDQANTAIEIAGTYKLPLSLTSPENASFNLVVKHFKSGNRDQALVEWDGLVRSLLKRNIGMSKIDELINWMLRKAYLETNRDLLIQSEKAYYYKVLKSEIGQYVDYLKSQLSKASQSPSGVWILSIQSIPPSRAGTPINIKRQQILFHLKELENEIDKAEKQMQEINKSFNLQFLQLQQDMQSENRQFTLMSNIMKTKHDTAKAAINNVR